MLTLGYGVNAVGTAILLATSWLAGTEISAAVLIPSLAIIGFGEGLGVSPLFGTVLNGVPDGVSGSASGIIETSGQLGMALGISVIGLMFSTALGGADSVGAYGEAFTVTLTGNLVLAVAALVLLPMLFGRKP